MSENFKTINSNNSLHEKKDAYNQFNGKIEVIKLNENNLNLRLTKANTLTKELPKFKIFNKRRGLNSPSNTIFSNVEIKKFINDTKENNTNKGSEYLLKKIANGNYIIINNLLTGKLNNHDNNDNDKEANLKNKKELKEQSTNTYINDVDINNYESYTLRLNSIDSNINKSSNYTNIPKKKIIKPKTSLNKKNKSINSVENTKIIIVIIKKIK